jgi:hypothetical protein
MVNDVDPIDGNPGVAFRFFTTELRIRDQAPRQIHRPPAEPFSDSPTLMAIADVAQVREVVSSDDEYRSSVEDPGQQHREKRMPRREPSQDCVVRTDLSRNREWVEPSRFHVQFGYLVTLAQDFDVQFDEARSAVVYQQNSRPGRRVPLRI